MILGGSDDGSLLLWEYSNSDGAPTFCSAAFQQPQHHSSPILAVQIIESAVPCAISVDACGVAVVWV